MKNSIISQYILYLLLCLVALRTNAVSYSSWLLHYTTNYICAPVYSNQIILFLNEETAAPRDNKYQKLKIGVFDVERLGCLRRQCGTLFLEMYYFCCKTAITASFSIIK